MATLRYRYQTIELGEHDIHFRSLRDRQQYNDDFGEAESIGISSANWPIAGLVWPSEEVLAQLMTVYDIENKRILEVGCGIGLASLVLNERLANITATDIHPNSGDTLQHNAQLNNGRHIPFLRTAWEDSPDQHFGLFDLIIGSDLLYERLHAELLAMFVRQTAKPMCEMLMVDGNRGHCPKFKIQMQKLGFECQQLDSIQPLTKPDNYTGKIFRFRRNYA